MINLSARDLLVLILIISCLVVSSEYYFSFWHGGRSAFHSSVLSSGHSQKNHWVDTWTATPQSYAYREIVDPPFTEREFAFEDATLRQTLQLTLGAEKIRLRLSNAFGAKDLPITNVTIALPTRNDLSGHLLGSRSIDLDTLQTVTFGGSEWVTIPDGALAVSDPITFDPPLKASTVLSVTMYFREGQDTEDVTTHLVSRTTSWMASGDYSRAKDMPRGNSVGRWFFVSAIEAWKEDDHKAIAVIGDSITDGRGGTVNINSKWPHLLFNRIHAEPNLGHISVINQGSGGNQLLYDGSRGPNAPSRIDRDILAQSGVGYVIIFEGINDIGHAGSSIEAQELVETRLIHYFKQIITRVHAFGIPVFGATITPFNCPTPNRYGKAATREQTRLRVNDWIRNSGWFDAVVDFDEALRSRMNATEIEPNYHVGDCLHPNDEGTIALAKRFPLELITTFKNGVDTFT